MGTLYKNGIPYGGGGGDNSKTVTYEEYKNLPEAERKNGTTYFVPDFPGGSSNTIMSWKLHADVTGVTAIEIPESFDEIHVKVYDPSSDVGYTFNFIPSDFDETTYFRSGHYATTTVYAICSLLVTPRSIRLEQFNLNGSVITDKVKVIVSYGCVSGGGSGEQLKEDIENIKNSLDNIMTVDTTEKIVGTWDGLPVYERLFRGWMASAETTTVVSDVYNCNNIQLISTIGEIKLSSGSRMQIGAYLNANYYSGLYVSGNQLMLYHSTGCAEYNITLRYVKL